MIALSPSPVEQVEIPWEGRSIAGLLYLQRAEALPPHILLCNGMDSIKELWPTRLHNWPVERRVQPAGDRWAPARASATCARSG